MDSNKNENVENEQSAADSSQNPPPGNSISLEEELSIAKKDLEAAQREILYVKAEFDNTRKRLLKEQEQSIKFANKNLITELLNVVDYFDRAIQHSKLLRGKAESEVANFISGVEMSQHEFVQLLSRFGVEFIGKVGETFDPEKHEAVGQKETEKDLVDKVLEVHQKGSLLFGKLVKPAKVVVGKEKNS